MRCTVIACYRRRTCHPMKLLATNKCHCSCNDIDVTVVAISCTGIVIVIGTAIGNGAVQLPRAISGVGHATDGPGRALGWSRVGGSRIKRRSHAGLPQAVELSRIKRQPRAVGATSSDHRVQ
ncbi:hypothetical protein B296_00044263 [Ensete ventricosum]|uniref:Uncharacterized protein n=1 Tax=Ensete ventricosum TaxID=4639 RepID=A0A426XPC8_ENSVE|nr:hypothetical protein B296_00044263 [Ensete ventricosum]